MLQYDLPLNEVVFDFYDRLKSVSKGYASFDYHITGYREGDLVKMSILVNAEPVDARSHPTFGVLREKCIELTAVEGGRDGGQAIQPVGHTRAHIEAHPPGTHHGGEQAHAEHGGALTRHPPPPLGYRRPSGGEWCTQWRTLAL